MLTQGQIGPITSTASISQGIQAPLRQGNMGDLVMSELHGRYYEAAYRRSIFVVANQAAVALTAGMATAYTGLCVGNPTSSTVNLVMLKASWAFTVTLPTAFTVMGLMTGVGASLTASLTPRNGYVGGASAQALATGGQTLPGTPVLERILNSQGVLAVASQGVNSVQERDLEGSMVLPPGAFVAFYSLAVNTACFIGSLMWEEVPI